MFDIGWTEMAVIALVVIIFIGPKELPGVLRTLGQWVSKARAMAREFQYKLGILGRDVGGHVVHDALSPVKMPCLHQFDEGTLIH